MHSWKFAANGVWEEALTFDARKPIDTNMLEQWITSHSQNIAFEAIFDDQGQPATMFGVRITSLPKAEQVAHTLKLIAETQAIKTENDFRNIATKIFSQFPLFAKELEALNIGIVGQWYSFIPEIVWDKNSEHPLTPGQLWQKAPRFFEFTRNPAAIEFWYTQPTDHWYKIYVSDPVTDGYALNPAKYQAAVNKLVSFKHKSPSI